jgi:hypothetical protein
MRAPTDQREARDMMCGSRIRKARKPDQNIELDEWAG